MAVAHALITALACRPMAGAQASMQTTFIVSGAAAPPGSLRW
jgi:hypothetical protein